MMFTIDGWCAVNRKGTRWAAWWTSQPTGSPWVTADASGVGGYENAERAVRAVKPTAFIRQIDASFGDAAGREHDGKKPSYKTPRPARAPKSVFREESGHTAPKQTFAQWTSTDDGQREFDAKVKAIRERLEAIAQLYEPGLQALVELGVTSIDPTDDDVRRAYRRKVAADRLHPDQGGDIAEFKRETRQCELAIKYVGRWRIVG